ncbi:Signal transduction histidine kinase [Candidatus Methanophagaceae archaeon]|nr:Signal transduction histidine kinase [Methanophagales archaeon]
MKVKRDNRWVILVICIILIGIVTFLGFKTHGEVEELVQQQFNEQQLLLARQAALGIGEFADERVTIIEIIARDRSEDSIDDITGCFKSIYEETSGFYSIEFVDANGVVVYGYPENSAPVGYNLYAENKSSTFDSARDKRETNISSSTALFEGGLGSFIWVPVYEGEEFRGVILAIIRMSTITDRFLTPIMQNRTGYVYLIDSKGKTLYDGTRSEAIGKNYIKMLKEVNTNASWLEILNEQINGSEGTAVYLKEGDKSKSEQIVAYAPVRWRDKIWSVGISVQASEVDHLISSVYAKQMIFLSTVIVIILGGSFGLILMFSRWNKTLEAEVESKTRDLTRTNKELAQANERLKELDKLKSEFVSMVSHELKTPLAAMKTSAQVLELADVEETTQQEMLSIITRNIDRQTNLVNDLLDLARVESGRLKLKFVSVALDAVIADSIEIVKPAADEKDITLDVKLPAGLASVKGDSEKLTQVVINLIFNAIKFTPMHGRITLKAKETDGQVEVEVCDTGIGIPAEDLDKVFDKFYQVDSTLTRETGGTGLGLAICKGLIEAHNGRIWTESELGKGSTFRFTLDKWLKDKTD